MITVITWSVIICYTATGFSSCFLHQDLPDAKGCDEVLAVIKAKRPVARIEQCFSRRTLVVSQTGTLPALPAGVEYLTTGPAK